MLHALRQISFVRCLSRTGLGAVLLLGARLALAKPLRCAGHGGVAGCDRSGLVTCQDGTLDRFRCDSSSTAGHQKKPRVLKFKPPPDRGQILKPGENPPSTTLKQSEKE